MPNLPPGAAGRPKEGLATSMPAHALDRSAPIHLVLGHTRLDHRPVSPRPT